MDEISERRLQRDSLGWLAQSSVQPKKQKLIQGVSGASLVDLQAQVYRAQDAKNKDGLGASAPSGILKLKHKRVDLSSRSNAGVEARAAKDELQQQQELDSAAASYAALQRKAALYDKLVAGGAAADEEAYEVDFLRKGGWLGRVRDNPASKEQASEREWHEQGEEYAYREESAPAGVSERERLLEEEEEVRREQFRRQEYKETVLGVAQETRESRDRAESMRLRKEQALRVKKERLKKAFVEQQRLKALKAAKQ